MPKLFGIDIAKEVANGMADAGGVLDAILIVVTPGTRTAGSLSAGVNPTERRVRCKGFTDAWSESELAGGRVQRGDRKIVLLGATIANGTVVPKPADKIFIEDETTTIVEDGVSRDPAAAAYTCQTRL